MKIKYFLILIIPFLIICKNGEGSKGDYDFGVEQINTDLDIVGDFDLFE